MIKVKIRHIDQLIGRELGQFSPDAIRQIVELVKKYGYYSSDEFCIFFQARFVPEYNESYFEIVVSNVEETS